MTTQEEQTLPCSLCGAPGIASLDVSLTRIEAAVFGADYALFRLCQRCMDSPKETIDAIEGRVRAIAQKTYLEMGRN